MEIVKGYSGIILSATAILKSYRTYPNKVLKNPGWLTIRLSSTSLLSIGSTSLLKLDVFMKLPILNTQGVCWKEAVYNRLDWRGVVSLVKKGEGVKLIIVV
jgi:hypothetical protein